MITTIKDQCFSDNVNVWEPLNCTILRTAAAAPTVIKTADDGDLRLPSSISIWFAHDIIPP